MAAAAAVRRSRVTVAEFGKLLPLRLRYCSSSSPQETKISEENVEPKKATSSKSKRARSMATLINTKPWSGELESSLSSLCTTPSNTTVLQTLQLIKTPSKAMAFFNWIEQKEGFSHNDHTYFKMLEILGRTRNLNAARNLLFSIEKRSGGVCRIQDKYFNSLIRSYGRADLFQESIKLFETMKSTGVSPSVITFNSLFSILLKRGRTNMVKSLYDEMLNTYGANPDQYTFNILIRGFCINAMIDDGFRFFKEMSRLNLDPDVVTYNTLVDGLCRAGKVKIAANVVKGMVKKSADLNPNVITYTTLIRGFCKKGEIDEALSVLQEMVDRDLKPNEITYNTLIRGLCEAKKFDKIKEILDATSAGFVPDRCTFNTLIHAHCSSGNLEAAMEAFSAMQKLQVTPDSATYSVLIRSLCQTRQFEKAEEFLDELLEKAILISSSGCTPLSAAYNPIFQHLCGTGKSTKADQVFRQLMKRGVQDPSSYRTLIIGHCKEGSFESGYEVLVLMLRRDYEPDLEIYVSLVDGLLAKGDPVLALRTLEKMVRSSHRPRTSTFHSVLSELLKKEFAEESLDLVMLMLEKDVRPNRDLSTDAVKLLLDRGLKRKAFELVKLLYRKGFVVDMEGVVDFLCRKRRFLEARELAVFGLEKDEKFSDELCDCLLRGLCVKKSVLEAFGLFYELVERGWYNKLSCLVELRDALLREGKSAEAEFVGKRMRIPCAAER